ncbi:phytanoyl-CoA dioxygenase family protein [Fictibacillus sp. KIGAM418]|uniref:Phytanoyl-CoA dioxygenase family protein n=1 Tax=Fictibacillus marinisediminis TaxID=2878389 RepID=A0A9X2BF41_9BACL|nr:phytanoyl-CoA dioxygenase family protein [Fictibacillus marinisediminis]MCK6259479.1 phytanoyl-CoA dioxygenase family protein [Fictibacillus marinisediminis]
MINNHNFRDRDVDLYQLNGHRLIKKLIDQEAIHQLRVEVHNVVNAIEKDHLSRYKRDDFGENFLEVTNLWTHSLHIKKFVTSKRLADIAARLLGVPSVRLHYDCIFFKEANGNATPWHQDQVSWPLDTNKTITAWIPLHDIPSSVGSLNFMSRSHAYQETNIRTAIRHGFEEVNYGALEVGDVTFHNGWTLHSANANVLSHRREAFAITYYEDGARVIDLPKDKYHSSFYQFFPGIEVGKQANSKLNPLL